MMEVPWSALRDAWEPALLLLTWGGILVVALQRRRDWRRKRFTQQVNFTLNYVEPGPDGEPTLMVRTLLEDSTASVFLNEYGVRLVQRAANRTTPEDPFLRVGEKEQREQVKRAVLNVLSERYSDAFLAQSMGVPVRFARYLFGMTWERYGDIHAHKLRVMVVRPDQLRDLFGEDGCADSVRLLAESHRPRLDTLRRMHSLWTSEAIEDRAVLGEIDLGVILQEPEATPPAPTGSEPADPPG